MNFTTKCITCCVSSLASIFFELISKNRGLMDPPAWISELFRKILREKTFWRVNLSFCVSIVALWVNFAVALLKFLTKTCRKSLRSTEQEIDTLNSRRLYLLLSIVWARSCFKSGSAIHRWTSSSPPLPMINSLFWKQTLSLGISGAMDYWCMVW